MTVYRCGWCGEVFEAGAENKVTPCWQCTHEFARLLGYLPRTVILPVAAGRETDDPVAAHRRIEFVDPTTGRARGRTAIRRRGRRHPTQPDPALVRVWQWSVVKRQSSAAS